ncbi:MAG: 50S ribosome-binding GTPase [Candidatus Contendobacter sp.]|nr:50S ribosome-binding GTPase [Candidatus Contendobacter sp.]
MPRAWRNFPDYWRRLREALLNPRVDDKALEAALREARARQPLPVVWLIGKTQAGKTSIIRALTGSEAAEIGNGFQPCTRTARFHDFPAEAPVVRFIDTRGLGEVAYDPSDDIHYCESQAHLLLGVMKATDIRQDTVFDVLRAVRRRHPEWPVLIAQTGLHEAYPSSGGHLLPYPYDREPWPPQVPVDLSRALRTQRDRLEALPGSAPVRWVPIDLTVPEDGYEPVNYGLDALWTAIEAISTLGLQAMLRGDVGIRDLYDRAAHPHIVGHALAAAGVGALPVVDLVGVPAVQASLLRVLAKLYKQDWNARMASEFLSLLGAGIGIGYVARTAGRELIKFVPWLGQTVGAVWGATASGATTYALGKAAGYYFANRRRHRLVDAEVLRRIYAEALASGANLFKKPPGENRP